MRASVMLHILHLAHTETPNSLFAHHKIQHQEKKHDKCDQVAHVLRATRGYHYPDLPDGVGDEICGAAQSGAHTIQHAILVFHFRIDVNTQGFQ